MRFASDQWATVRKAIVVQASSAALLWFRISPFFPEVLPCGSIAPFSSASLSQL
jgi:hypothetical protein